MDINKELKLAVLIDADNIPSTNVKGMLEEIAKYGTPTFKRIYGDWTKPQLSGWKKVLLDNAITPVQQYSYTTGKNSTDSALIIEAMDILYTGGVDGFCIVSSDSDFTRLATRLREAGKKVFGIGQKKTPSPFIASCNKFIYLEILQQQDEKEEETTKEAAKKTVKLPSHISIINKELTNLILSSINDSAEEDGWVFLGTLGSFLLKKQPDFDPRNYGFKKLVDIIKRIPRVQLDERQTGKNNISHFYVRIK
ncbi:MAG: NYN domain-containing protein [Chitinophagaceae bacterium]